MCGGRIPPQRGAGPVTLRASRWVPPPGEHATNYIAIYIDRRMRARTGPAMLSVHHGGRCGTRACHGRIPLRYADPDSGRSWLAPASPDDLRWCTRDRSWSCLERGRGQEEMSAVQETEKRQVPEASHEWDRVCRRDVPGRSLHSDGGNDRATLQRPLRRSLLPPRAGLRRSCHPIVCHRAVPYPDLLLVPEQW